MKPDWSTAPSWAKHLTRDNDGEWWWHENEPTFDPEDGGWYSSGEMIEARRDRQPAYQPESRP